VLAQGELVQWLLSTALTREFIDPEVMAETLEHVRFRIQKPDLTFEVISFRLNSDLSAPPRVVCCGEVAVLALLGAESEGSARLDPRLEHGAQVNYTVCLLHRWYPSLVRGLTIR